MNIKGLLGPNVMPNVRSIDKTDRTIRSENTHDRDANGQQAFDDGKKKEREPMTEQQLAMALEHLRQLPAVKEHHWTVELVILEDQKKYVLVKDNLGNLIRRIPELDLWTLELDEQGNKGHLLKRSA